MSEMDETTVLVRKPSRHHSLNHWTNFDTVVTIISVIVCFITVFPMWYVIVMSLSDPIQAASGNVVFWPIGFTFDSYLQVAQNHIFWHCMLNSFGYVVAGCILMLFNTICMAYPLTRPNLKARKFITIFLVIPMYFGGGMIPSFILVTKLGLYNTPWALILPGLSIWNIILCRTYMNSIPHELSEAAFIDGATNMQALTKIYLPLSKPVLAVILIYTIVDIWNSWFGAMLYTTKQELQPVQLYLQNLLATSNLMVRQEIKVSQEIMEQWSKQAMGARQLKYTMIVVVTLPILLVYPMFQKHFTKGVMLGSLKG